jgi:PAS domain S-box-containing protein
MINPAYMTRQAHELGQEQYGARGHITSLNPIRAQNLADEWEKKALEAFQAGTTEVSSVEIMNGRPFLRFMRPMFTEVGCLGCHATQGYKLGDIRGGISVSLPLTPYLEAARRQQVLSALGHGLIGFLGLLGIWFSARALTHHLSDRNRAEEALRKSEEKFRRLAENAKDMIYRMSLPDGQYEYVSPASTEMFGYTPEEFYASPALIQTAIHPNWVAYFKEQWANLLSGNMPPVYEYQILHKSGDERWIHQRNVLIRDENGHPKAIEGIVSDITASKRAEANNAELEAQSRQLKKAESLSRMAGAIAHHFNNQLMVVIGNLEQGIEDSPLKDTPQENLTGALKAARRAAEVSGMMLTYLGQTAVKKELLDISEVCRRSLPSLRFTLPPKIQLRTDFPFPGPTINGNANQVRQILNHLLTNAWESCDGSGSVQLNIKTVYTEDISRSNRLPIEWQPLEQTYACLEVRDSGHGITEEDFEKIFDPFFTSKFTGRGLGLAVVLGIVRSLNGAITVESKPGLGSTFRVFLPRSAEKVARLPENAATAPDMEVEGTVLLVEDEEPVRKMVTTMLKRLGFTVLEARNGLEAVDVFRRQKDEIRFVLCDLTMPQMNGWETLSALRDLAPGLPIILASGHDEGQVMAANYPDQPDAFLHKPFSRKELADTIRHVWARRGGH